MLSSSLYLATVLLATLTFCCLSISVIFWSLKGFLGFSSATIFLIVSLTDVEETMPDSELRPLEKKYLKLKSPWLQERYLLAVALLMVLSCICRSPAMSLRFMGLRADTPLSK